MTNEHTRVEEAKPGDRSAAIWRNRLLVSLGLFSAVYLAALLLGVTLSALRN